MGQRQGPGRTWGPSGGHHGEQGESGRGWKRLRGELDVRVPWGAGGGRSQLGHRGLQPVSAGEAQGLAVLSEAHSWRGGTAGPGTLSLPVPGSGRGCGAR